MRVTPEHRTHNGNGPQSRALNALRGGDPTSTAIVASHPTPAAIQRRAKRRNTGATHRQRGPNRPSVSVSAPQRYKRSASLQRKASQAPERLREITCPKGQGSARQHTPQPLHGAPSAGLLGASGWMWMTWCMAMEG